MELWCYSCLANRWLYIHSFTSSSVCFICFHSNLRPHLLLAFVYSQTKLSLTQRFWIVISAFNPATIHHLVAPIMNSEPTAERHAWHAYKLKASPHYSVICQISYWCWMLLEAWTASWVWYQMLGYGPWGSSHPAFPREFVMAMVKF